MVSQLSTFEMKIEYSPNEKNKKHVLNIPSNLGYVTMNILINNKTSGILEQFNTNDKDKFCYELSEKTPPNLENSKLTECLSD